MESNQTSTTGKPFKRKVEPAEGIDDVAGHEVQGQTTGKPFKRKVEPAEGVEDDTEGHGFRRP